MGTNKPMHRISRARRQQGVSLQKVAEDLHKPIDCVREQESETSDLCLSELWAWHDILGVSVQDLLIDRDGPLQGPEIDRSQIHRLMLNASYIRDNAPSLSIQRLAKMMVAQLLEIMPEENP